MASQVIAGAAMVGAAIPLAFWAVAGNRSRSAAVALQRGFDVRSANLERPALERTLGPIVRHVTDKVKRVTPVGVMTDLEKRLAYAGMQGTWTAERVVAIKLVLVTIGALLSVMLLSGGVSVVTLFAAIAAPALGWFAPDGVLSGRGEDRQSEIQRTLPDFMDQVTIAVEAGLGFEAALARVAQNGDGVLAVEISRMLQDIQLGMPRTDALEALAQRCNVADLRHFVTAIRQAERYGLAIANVLRVQSTEMREKRKQRAEEHAMKIPIKVLFPLILCILPSLFIVIMGPAVLRMIDAFS